MTDGYIQKGKRLNMLKELENKGFKDKAVLNAMNEVPRHFYLHEMFENFAYEDQAFKIGCGQTISHPSTVAFQTELLQIQKGDKVLIHDDVLATGGTLLAGSELIAKTGAKLTNCAVFIEISALNGRNRLSSIPVHSSIIV